MTSGSLDNSTEVTGCYRSSKLVMEVIGCCRPLEDRMEVTVCYRPFEDMNLDTSKLKRTNIINKLNCPLLHGQ